MNLLGELLIGLLFVVLIYILTYAKLQNKCMKYAHDWNEKLPDVFC